MKNWGKGQRGRCRQVRDEFVEVVLDPLDEGDDEDETKSLWPLFIVKMYNLDSGIIIRNKKRASLET
jgi:hypothetical protein